MIRSFKPKQQIKTLYHKGVKEKRWANISAHESKGSIDNDTVDLDISICKNQMKLNSEVTLIKVS